MIVSSFVLHSLTLVFTRNLLVTSFFELFGRGVEGTGDKSWDFN